MGRTATATIAAFLTLAVIGSACTASETVIVLDDAQSTTASTDSAQPAIEPTAQTQPDMEPETEPEPAADRVAPAPLSAGDAQCLYMGVDSFGDMQLELRLTSDLRGTGDVVVPYVVLDSTGLTIVDSSEFIEDLAPDESVWLAVDTLTEPPIVDSEVTCAIGEIANADLGGPAALRPTAQDTCRFVEIDFADDIQIELTVSNPLDSGAELVVGYALRGPDGIRFGDGVTFSQEVGAGQSITFGDDTVTEFPDWVTEATFTCHILSIDAF